jgi:phosphorylase kinase alpha/beta subunit
LLVFSYTHELFSIRYKKIYPNDIYHAVLMQELIINISKCISTSPELFDGILKLRLGWILDCMQQELNDMNDDNQDKIVKNYFF